VVPALYACRRASRFKQVAVWRCEVGGENSMSKPGAGVLSAILSSRPRGGRLVFILAGLFCAGALSQSTGPTDSKGSTTKVLASIDLASEIDAITGRQLRARLVTIEPGGHTTAHSHKDRPTVEYVLQGTVVEMRNGIEIQHQAGDMVLGRHDVNHWWENRGTTPVVLLPVDVFKP